MTGTLKDWKLAKHHKCLIAASMTLRTGVTLGSVLGQIEAAARTYWLEWDVNESKYKDIDLSERASGKPTLRLGRRRHASRGGVEKAAMRSYITALVSIYQHATGERIVRYNVVYPAREIPHPFLLACLKPIGKRYPPRIVQDMLHATKC